MQQPVNLLGPHTLIHGADYNPEQWADRPDILAEDIRLMKKAGMNCVSVGIFSWARLEPEEGRYELDWLADLVDTLYQNGIYSFLATPSGARPHWMAQKYPEVLRVAANGVRNHMGGRHNHCYTSPVYREKVRAINTRLAQRLGAHPGVVLWHISNEYCGDCFCKHCQEAFRDWLKVRYGSLESLNKAWWTTFWSHTYTDWSQVEPPLPNGERLVHGLNLDWKRFTTHQTLDFYRFEKQALRDAGSDKPATTNMMEFFTGLNYFKFKDDVDIFSWDSYPAWHSPGANGDKAHMEAAVVAAGFHDLMRSAKKQPFLLMESTPSAVNWRGISKLKKPGMHRLSSLQAVAHGANSVQYFQWRKSRGSSEKFHGAVVGHDGRDDARVFTEVAELGAELKALGSVAGAMPRPRVALVYDWENRWALEDSAGPRSAGTCYQETVLAHYKALWKLGVAVDFVDMECGLEGYALVCAPLLYMLRGGMQQRLARFVAGGGTLVTGPFTGLVDESDLAFLGDAPNGLCDVLGLRVEETDALYDGEQNTTSWQGKSYALLRLCDRVHPTSAEVLATYESDFYAGEPVLCRNTHGAGRAWYLASCPVDGFYDALYTHIAGELALPRAWPEALPENVVATARGEYVLLQNYGGAAQRIALPHTVLDVETGESLSAEIDLAPFGCRFIEPHTL